MKVFISGGCKSGKSALAEKISVYLAKDAGPLHYAATMLPTDKEDEDRIIRHRDQRGHLGFETIEMPRDIRRLQDSCAAGGTVLIDSLTALLANEMFSPDGEINDTVHEKIITDLSVLFLCIKNVIIVSDFIYSDAAFYDKLTLQYRNGLAAIDKFCALACDTVFEAFCGSFITYKGGETFGEVF